jgi:hypothetical protein
MARNSGTNGVLNQGRTGWSILPMKKLIWVLLFLAFLIGCEPVDSLNPLYTESDVVFDYGLSGVWQSPDGDDGTITFIRNDMGVFTDRPVVGYSILMKDKDGSSSKYVGYLLNIAGKSFLDVMPTQWEANSSSFPLHLTHSKEKGAGIMPRLLRLGMASYLEFTDNSPEANAQIVAKLRPAHWFFKVIRTDNKLRMEWMDDEKFEKAVEAGKVKIGNSLLRNEKHTDVVITAGTKELQRFIADHADDHQLFSENMDLVRKP